MVIKMDIIKIKLNDEKEQSLNSIKEILEEACFLKKRVEVIIEIDFKPESNFIYRIFTLFFDYESCFLKSILYVNKASVDVLKITLRAEDELFIKTPTIIIGDVHKDAITSFAEINPQKFVSSSLDCTIKVWELIEKKLTLLYPHSSATALTESVLLNSSCTA